MMTMTMTLILNADLDGGTVFPSCFTSYDWGKGCLRVVSRDAIKKD